MRRGRLRPGDRLRSVEEGRGIGQHGWGVACGIDEVAGGAVVVVVVGLRGLGGVGIAGRVAARIGEVGEGLRVRPGIMAVRGEADADVGKEAEHGQQDSGPGEAGRAGAGM